MINAVATSCPASSAASNQISVFSYVKELANVHYFPISADFNKFESDYIKLAFDYCHQIIKHHSKTFSMAASLLDHERRNAIAALYGICRISDDIVDKDLLNKQQLMKRWQKSVNSQVPNIADPVQLAWLYTRAKYKIPSKLMDQLITGVVMDTHKTRYATYEELVQYCYYVASTVGLMSMHIIGYSDEKAIPYAIEMGVALQLTNIIRDVGEDYRMGRIYIPQEEMDRFGITEDHFKNRIIDDAWKALIAFQIQRARRLYQNSWKGLSYLESKGKWSIAAAATLYKEILKMVERNQYDNLNHRAFVSKKRKLFLLSKLLVN